MKKPSKYFIKVFTSIFINIKKHYRLYRKLNNLVHPHCGLKKRFTDTTIQVNDRKIPIRVIYPNNEAKQKALLYFHGGGWIAGSINAYTKICADIAEKTKHIVVLIDYRLAPEHPFPTGLEDCYAAAREVLRDNNILSFPKNAITLIGDSAGGNLAAAVSLMLRDNGDIAPNKQILIYPPTHYDHSEDSPFSSIKTYGKAHILTAKRINDYMDLYVPNKKDRDNPYVAPIVAEDLSSLPKTLIITAEFDPLRDEGEAFGERLKEFENEVVCYRIESALHGFLTFPKKAECLPKVYDIINEFLINEEQG